MERPNLTRQSTASVPIASQSSSAWTPPLPSHETSLATSAPLDWLFNGPGWTLLRPTIDLLMTGVAVVLALGGLGATTHVSASGAPLLALPLFALILFHLRGLYRTRLWAPLIDDVVPLLRAVTAAAMAAAALALIVNGQISDNSVWLRAWLFAVLAVGAGRVAVALSQHWARSRRAVSQPVLIIGAGLVGAQLARRLVAHPEYGLWPVGFLDDDPRPTEEVGARHVPVLGSVDEIAGAVRETGAQRVLVAFSGAPDAEISSLVQHCQELGVEVSVVPRLYETINDRVSYETVAGLPVLSFSGVDPKGARFAVKHAFDRVFAAVMLVLLAPLVCVLALAVLLSSPGPVLFRQRRVGRDGRAFDLYKFRTMHMQEPLGPLPANVDATGATAPGGVEGADRRTAVGRFLRRSSLDELPQLLNVLRGEMSIVGPRPERPEFVELFGRDIARYGDRHRVKSGITGWAQVHGLRGRTSLADRVEHDNFYIAHWSLGLDMKIIVMTLSALFHDVE